MRTSLLITLLAVLLLTCSTLRTLVQSVSDLDRQSSEGIGISLVNQQTDIYRKIVRHFLDAQIAFWERSGLSEDSRKREMLKLTVTKFTQEKLYMRFEMDKLANSFQEEIKAHPENYFLTSDMYDLLYD